MSGGMAELTRVPLPADGAWHHLTAVSSDGRFFARKCRAWMHHTALTALALWFVAETKLDCAHQHPRDPTLACELGVEALPMLPTANVRELVVMVLPLRQLSQTDAVRLVTKHLVQRSRSTAGRLRAQARERASP